MVEVVFREKVALPDTLEVSAISPAPDGWKLKGAWQSLRIQAELLLLGERDAAASTGRLMDAPLIQIHAIKDYSAGRRDRPPTRTAKLVETPERAACAFFSAVKRPALPLRKPGQKSSTLAMT